MNMATEDEESATGPEETDATAGGPAEDREPATTADTTGSPEAGTEVDAEASATAMAVETPDDSMGAAGEDGAGDTDSGDHGYAAGAIKRILEAALLVAGRPLTMNDFEKLFGGSAEAPPRNAIRGALAELGSDWSGRSLSLQEVASGWRAQVRTEFEPWIARLWDEKPPRYSRALLETLAIIAYRQPMTRSEIEDIRGVSVSSQIIRTLTEREWIRVVGHREAPGRPAMYGTTREFLDYFNLKTLDQLPPISDIKDLEGQYPELGFEAEPATRGSSEQIGASAEPEGGQPDAAQGDDGGDDGASAGAADANGVSGDDPDAGEEPAMQDALSGDEEEASQVDEYVRDDDTDDDTDEDADDAEEPPCTPAS
jgi:segregation and condensation protein B